VMLVVACTTTDDAPTVVPTQPLVLYAPTVTPLIPTVAAVSASPLAPAYLPTTMPINLMHLETDLERQIASLALDDLASIWQIPAQEIQVIHVAHVFWNGIVSNCPEKAQDYSNRNVEGFWIVLSVEGVIYEYHTDEGTTIRLCAETPVQAVRGDILTLVDPIAADMVSLARQRIASDRDLPTSRINLLDIYAVTWNDGSLGCPVEDQDYIEIEIDGYRLVLEVGDTEYIFHTDFDRPVICDVENEVLP